jgi:molybdopterin-biosynthesis enzyme MoeA-like protein
MIAEIITIGDEILIGQIVDSNSKLVFQYIKLHLFKMIEPIS